MSLPIHLEVIQAKRRSEGGGGGGAWYDAALYADKTGDADTDSTWLIYTDVSLPAGTTTKVRVGISAWQLSHKILVGLYDSGGSLVAQTAKTATAANGVMEINWTSSVGTSAATYTVGITVETGNVFKVGKKGSVGSYAIATISPSYTMPATLPSSGWHPTDTLCVGVWVE